MVDEGLPGHWNQRDELPQLPLAKIKVTETHTTLVCLGSPAVCAALVNAR